MSEYLTELQRERVIGELTINTRGLPDEELRKAFDTFKVLVTLAGLVENWRRGYLQIGWDPQRQDITWAPTEAGRQAAQAG